jgi:uncharacterized protein (DUF39 family)
MTENEIKAQLALGTLSIYRLLSQFNTMNNFSVFVNNIDDIKFLHKLLYLINNRDLSAPGAFTPLHELTLQNIVRQRISIIDKND